MLTLGLGRMILSVWYRCPPWSWSSSSSVMYSTSSSSSAIAWPCTAVSPVMICKFRQDHKFIESRWNEIKKGSTDAVSDVGSKNTEQMRILQISDCLRKLKNKGTIRQVSTNQRVWDQVNKQTQLVPWMKDRAQREKQGKWKGDRGFHKEKKQMKGRHRTGARGWETRVDTWTNDVASSSQAQSGQREEWRAACKKQKKYKDNKKNEGSRANLKTKSNYKDQDNEKNERPRAKSHLKESLIAVALLLVASFPRAMVQIFLGSQQKMVAPW